LAFFLRCFAIATRFLLFNGSPRNDPKPPKTASRLDCEVGAAEYTRP